MWGRKARGVDHARAVDARSRQNAASAEQARSESARLAAVARPVQEELRSQVDRNHWAELIFGRVN